MLMAEQRERIRSEVVAAYGAKYKGQPEWADVDAVEILDNTHIGTMVTVKSSGSAEGEICVHTKGGVLIFDTTPELMRYLDSRARRIVTVRDYLMAVVVLATIALFSFIVIDRHDEHAVALVTTAMAGILGTFAGVSIGTRKE